MGVKLIFLGILRFFLSIKFAWGEVFTNKVDILGFSHERKLKIAEENVQNRKKKKGQDDGFGWDEAPIREMVRF